MNISRREFASISFLIAAGGAILPRVARAVEPDEVTFTSEIAVEVTNSFLETDYPASAYYAGNPIPFFYQVGKIAGYVVSVYCNGETSGYVVLDTTSDVLISEFAIGVGYNDLESSLLNGPSYSSESLLHSEGDCGSIIYRDGTNGYILFREDDSGVSEFPSDPFVVHPTTFSDDPTRPWDEATYSINKILGDFQINEWITTTNAFYSIAQSTITSQANRYACLVTAGYTCAQMLGILPHSTTYFFADEYLDIWNKTQTVQSGSGSGYITGSTSNRNYLSGMQSYCSEHGVSVSTDFKAFDGIPALGIGVDDFTSAVRRHSPCVLGSANHGVTVEGFIDATNSYTSQDMQFLTVYDGWYTGARQIYYNSSSLTNKVGLFLNA